MECDYLDPHAYRGLQHAAVYGLQGTSPAEIQVQLCTVTVCATLENRSHAVRPLIRSGFCQLCVVWLKACLSRLPPLQTTTQIVVECAILLPAVLVVFTAPQYNLGICVGLIALCAVMAAFGRCVSVEGRLADSSHTRVYAKHSSKSRSQRDWQAISLSFSKSRKDFVSDFRAMMMVWSPPLFKPNTQPESSLRTVFTVDGGLCYPGG